MDNFKALAMWSVLFVLAMIFLIIAFTGRMGILLSIAVLPDNVAYIGNGS